MVKVTKLKLLYIKKGFVVCSFRFRQILYQLSSPFLGKLHRGPEWFRTIFFFSSSSDLFKAIFLPLQIKICSHFEGNRDQPIIDLFFNVTPLIANKIVIFHKMKINCIKNPLGFFWKFLFSVVKPRRKKLRMFDNDFNAFLRRKK